MTRRIGPYAVLDLPVRAAPSAQATAVLAPLKEACAAGERIAWDQSHRLALELHALATTALQRSEGAEREALQSYLSLFALCLGPYDARSGEKLAAPLPKDRLEALLGAPLPTAVASFWYDAKVSPTRTAPQATGRDADPIANVGANFYQGVTAADLAAFDERYPRNSRVIMRADGSLFEEVYRAGRDATPGRRPSPRGRYSQELGAVVDALQRAEPLAPPTLAAYLAAIREHLITGEPRDLANAEDLWLDQEGQVAASFGFIETDWDPRARKGLWQGLVVVDDAPLRQMFQALAAAAPDLEARGPWGAQYRRPRQDPTLPWPVEVVAGAGATGPILPAELTLPNETLSRKRLPKTWLLSNVVRAVDEAMDELTLPAFASAPDQADARRFRGLLTDLQLALDAIVGQPAWRPVGALAGKDPAIALKELSTPLEYLRRALVGLYYLTDPAVQAAAPECGDGCVRAAYRRLVRHETILLGRTAGIRIEDEHHRALRAVVAWLNDKGAARVDLPAAGDDTTPIGYRVDDGLARQAVSELLAEVMRIGSEGDYEAARRVFERTDLPDPEVMAPLRRRVALLGLPEAYAFEPR